MLKARGSTDEVVSLTDCLAFGPIADGDWHQRAAWLDAHTPIWQGWDWIVDSAADFLDRVRSCESERLLWIAPQSVCEQCGLQWYFEQVEGAAAGPMIIADQPIQFKRRASVPLGLGELAGEYMADLLDNAPRREWPADRASPQTWRGLRSEDRRLRIVEGGSLRSVMPDHFDRLLLAQCTTEWRKWAPVVGHAMIDAMEVGHHTSDVFYYWRLRELVKKGAIECQGELPGPEHGPDKRATAELRLPGS